MASRRVRGGKTVRIPVVWVFGDNAGAYGSREKYSRVDFIDWTPNGCTLLRRYDCWGTGAEALKRLLHQTVDTMDGQLLTESGHTRMRQVLEWDRSKHKPSKQLLRVSENDKTLSSELRKLVHDVGDVLPADVASKLDKISEKSYAGLLRTCVIRGLEKQTCRLLKHRPLPQYSRENLLGHFVTSTWCEVWKTCSNEARPYFTQSGCGGYSLWYKVLQTGNIDLLKAVLDSLSEIGVYGAQYLVEHVFEENRMDLLEVILASPVVQPIREECLKHCFTHSLYAYRRNNAVAFTLLQLGVRPIRNIDTEEAFGLRHWLLESENLPILKRVFELEQPTPIALGALLDSYDLKPSETFSWLCTVSKGLPEHKTRMERIAFRTAVTYIRGGQEEKIKLLSECFAEGVSLKDVPWNEFENAKLLTGSRRQKEEGNWIDLIGHLIKGGRTEDATVLKKLSRTVKRSRGAASRAK